ncbi:tRNA pseudouridine38/39 synthase, partial [Lecanoromycetidae sp. Uapishka_2]
MELGGRKIDYSEWSTDDLIRHVESLEQQLREQKARDEPRSRLHSTSPTRKPKNARVNREFDDSKYSTRLIALKFAYLGQCYNGLEFHRNNKTPLPTVEEELYKALSKARLIFPTSNPTLELGEPNWEGTEYSKCGRTDKGVSAFGQVVGIRVRSNRPIGWPQTTTSAEEAGTEGKLSTRLESSKTHLDPPVLSIDPPGSRDGIGQPAPHSSGTNPYGGAEPFHPVHDEIRYCQILNRLLPPDIRMLAWCPSPPLDFSARFSCRERRYKYFFSQPAFTPTHGLTGLMEGTKGPTAVAGRRREGWLDIAAMRQAAQKFVGLHDFRNFCKVDPSKQIENFERRIFHSDIEEMDSLYDPVGYVGQPDYQQYEDLSPGWRLAPSVVNGEPFTPKLYTFTLHGSAFLWHQVRHMVGILFLIGQGLEPPSLVDELLDVQKNPCKPQYEMADDAPLVLWDCVFPKGGSDSRDDALEWIYLGDTSGAEKAVESANAARGDGRHGLGGVIDEMWRVWRRRKIDEVLAGALLGVIVTPGTCSFSNDSHIWDSAKEKSRASQKVFQGGNGPRLVGRYISVLEKPRMGSVEEINKKYAERKGFDQKGRASGQISDQDAPAQDNNLF